MKLKSKCIKNVANATITPRELREKAFLLESDPLVGRVLRGEVSIEEFKLVAETIRTRYPD
jgi:hypothetical protein